MDGQKRERHGEDGVGDLLAAGVFPLKQLVQVIIVFDLNLIQIVAIRAIRVLPDGSDGLKAREIERQESQDKQQDRRRNESRKNTHRLGYLLINKISF